MVERCLFQFFCRVMKPFAMWGASKTFIWESQVLTNHNIKKRTTQTRRWTYVAEIYFDCAQWKWTDQTSRASNENLVERIQNKRSPFWMRKTPSLSCSLSIFIYRHVYLLWLPMLRNRFYSIDWIAQLFLLSVPHTVFSYAFHYFPCNYYLCLSPSVTSPPYYLQEKKTPSRLRPISNDSNGHLFE